MAGKHKISEGSQSRGVHRTIQNKRESKNSDKTQETEISSSTASISKQPKRTKPHKPTEALKEETSPYKVIDNRSTSGPKSLNESSHKIPFRVKDKEPINSGSGKASGSSFDEEMCKEASRPPDVLLVIDLNSRNPTAAFYAPCLGYSSYKFLPALEAMSKTREAFLTNTKSGPGISQSSHSSSDWTKEFLFHCRILLGSELGRPLEDFILEFSFTARGDASYRSKAMLVGTVRAAGFIISTEDAVQICPTVEAVAIEAVRRHAAKSFDINSPYPGGVTKADYSILVLHYDGDVAEIQSYSASWKATEEKSSESRLRLEEITYGETVECGRLIDLQFTRLIEKSFGNSVSGLSANNISTDGHVMAEFAKVRRNYRTDQKDLYSFPLTYRNPLHGAFPGSHHHVRQLQVQDSEMRSLFAPAMDSLIKSLDDHHARVGRKKKTIDEVIFAGEACIAPYVEDHLKDWGIGVGLLYTNIQAFPMTLGRYIRVDASPEMIVQGAIHGNYPGVEVVPRSRAHYGFRLSKLFEDGDPAWSRREDHWDNTDLCDQRVIWQVQKDQLLDSHAVVSERLWQKLVPDQGLSTSLELYKCALDNPPRWVRIHQNISNPDMELIGAVEVRFNEEDFRDGQHKLCDDGVYRRRLHFTARVLCGHRTRNLRVTAMSADGRRVLGNAVFRYE